MSDSLLIRARYPSDVIALMVLWHLRYKLSRLDLAEMFLVRGIVFSHEAVLTMVFLNAFPWYATEWPKVPVPNPGPLQQFTGTKS